LKGKKQLKYQDTLFVARPTAGKTTLLTSNPQASQAAAAIGICSQ
jgi:transcription termination factor Rho